MYCFPHMYEISEPRSQVFQKHNTESVQQVLCSMPSMGNNRNLVLNDQFLIIIHQPMMVSEKDASAITLHILKLQIW